MVTRKCAMVEKRFGSAAVIYGKVWTIEVEVGTDHLVTRRKADVFRKAMSVVRVNNSSHEHWSKR